MLDPNPLILLHGPLRWPVYDDTPVRIHLIMCSEIDAVLRIRFFKHDLLASVADFFKTVFSKVQINELWLGATQTLGRGSKGNFAEISRLARQNNIRLKRLNTSSREVSRARVCEYLANGNLAAAIRIVQRAPVWTRMRSRKLRLAWHPGVYQAATLNNLGARQLGCPIDIYMTLEESGLVTSDWPGHAKYLTFISGPCDGEEADDYQAISQPEQIMLRALNDPQFRELLKVEPQKTLERTSLSRGLIQEFRKNTMIDGHSLIDP